VKRIAALRDQLAIHDTPPKINEVVGGMIAARTRAGASVVSGVYDRSSRLADGSVPFRGRTVWKRIAEPETKKLGRIFDDSRVAYYLGYANVHYGHFSARNNFAGVGMAGLQAGMRPGLPNSSHTIAPICKSLF